MYVTNAFLWNRFVNLLDLKPRLRDHVVEAKSSRQKRDENSYAKNPSPEISARFTQLQVPEHGQKNFLHHFFGVMHRNPK